MSVLKDKLNAAINSVFDDMYELSTEELKAEIDSYLLDHRTDSLIYAWDYDAVRLDIPQERGFEWTEFSHAYESPSSALGGIPALFYEDSSFIIIEQGCEGIQKKVSDDYFFFKAAA